MEALENVILEEIHKIWDAIEKVSIIISKLYNNFIPKYSQLPSKRKFLMMFSLSSFLFFLIRSLKRTNFFPLSINYENSKTNLISK